MDIGFCIYMCITQDSYFHRKSLDKGWGLLWYSCVYIYEAYELGCDAKNFLYIYIAKKKFRQRVVFH